MSKDNIAQKSVSAELASFPNTELHTESDPNDPLFLEVKAIKVCHLSLFGNMAYSGNPLMTVITTFKMLKLCSHWKYIEKTDWANVRQWQV